MFAPSKLVAPIKTGTEACVNSRSVLLSTNELLSPVFPFFVKPSCL
jgi:hypothetical protein